MEETYARPSWDETWMGVAAVMAKRAACLRSKVGAVVVVDNKRTFVGYNGVPAGEQHCTDGGCPRAACSVHEQLPPGSPYDECPALHAEQNALLRAGDRANGGTLYVTREPCNWCWKNIRASGVSRVVWLDNTGHLLFERNVKAQSEAS